MTIELLGGPTAPARPLDEGDLAELLSAFQFLQGRNARMASSLSAFMGIGLPDLRVLLYLSRMPGATPKEIASQLDQSSGSVTALLDRLETTGRLERHAHPSDRRSVTLRLTDSGERVVRAVHGSYHDAFAGIFSGEQVSHVAEILRTLGDALPFGLPPAPAATTDRRN